MKFEPLFPKKRSKSLDDRITEVDVQLRGVDGNLHTVVSREIRVLRNNKNNRRAKEKIKTAVYGMMIVHSAQEALRDIDTTNALNKTMNDLTTALRSLNGISFRSEKMKENKFEKAVGKMERDAEARGGMGITNLADEIDSIVSDDVIERLLKGEKLDNCLMDMDEEFRNVSEDMFSESDILNNINFGEDNSNVAEDDNDIINEFMKNL